MRRSAFRRQTFGFEGIIAHFTPIAKSPQKKRPETALSPVTRRLSALFDYLWLPKKKRATVPGPEWAPMTGPI